MLWLKALITLLPNLLKRWDEYRVQRRKAKRDEDIEEIKDDPVGYANDHFGGVPDKSTKPDVSSRKAKDTDK